MVLGCLVICIASFMASGQIEGEGIEILDEGTSGEEVPAGTIGDLIIEPVRLSALLGYAMGGSPWIEFSAGAGLWLGNLRLSSEAELRGAAFTLNVDAETQWENLGLSAGARFSRTGIQLSGGLNTTIEDFTLAGWLAVGGGGSVATASATTKMGSLEVFASAGLAPKEVSISAGVTLPGDPLTLSAGATLGGTAGLTISGGADLAVSDALSFFADAGLGTTGLTTTVGGRLSTETLQVSAYGTWDANGLGLTSDGNLNLSSFDLFGTLRMDADSFSADIGGSMQLGNLTTTLTVGLDQQGFKWVQIEVRREFDVFG